MKLEDRVEQLLKKKGPRGDLYRAKYRVGMALGDWQKRDPAGANLALHRYVLLRGSALMLFWFAVLKISIPKLLQEPPHWLIDYAAENAFLATIFLSAVGMLLYVFRDQQRYYYGLTEVAFAVGLVFIGASQLTTEPTKALAQIAAALYVFVRGTDNAVVGYNTPPKADAGAVKAADTLSGGNNSAVTISIGHGTPDARAPRRKRGCKRSPRNRRTGSCACCACSSG